LLMNSPYFYFALVFGSCCIAGRYENFSGD
jgi:hypothetical protein